MKISKFRESNKTFVTPTEWKEEGRECEDLPAFVQEGLIISCWQFTDEEMLLAVLKRKMWLHIFLNFQPPVLLTPEFPFMEGDFGDGITDINEIIEKLITRKVQQFIEHNRIFDDYDCGIKIHDEEKFVNLLKNLIKSVFATKTE